MGYKPGDVFIQQLFFDVMDYGICAVETTDTPNYCLQERIPPMVILSAPWQTQGGYYYG